MNNTLKLTKYVLDMLKNDDNVKDVIDTNNIYPVDARLGTKFPFAVVTRTSITASNAKDGLYEDVVYFSVIIVDDTYSGSINIATVIRNALDRRAYQNEEVSISQILLTNATENLYNDVFIQQLDFSAYFDTTF